MNITLDREDWLAALGAELERTLGRPFGDGDLVRLIPPRGTLDDPAKYLLRRSAGEPDLVLYLAPEQAPGIVHRHLERAEAARRVLGETLGRVILEPIGRGEVAGRSYALMPLCQSFTRTPVRWWTGRMLLQSRLFGWLRAMTARTAGDPGSHPSGPDEEMMRALECLRGGEFATRFAARLDRAIERLSDGTWVPRRVLMHGDLWLDNVLIAPRGLQGHGEPVWWDRFLIIDWPGSRVDGFAFYDLVRLALSLRIRPRRLRREVLAHAARLGCEPVDAWGYLGAALGSIGLNLEHFSPAQYRRIVQECLTCLESIGV